MNTLLNRLWQPGFTLLFSSRVLKDLAENFASIAFVWLLIENGGDEISTSILFFCSLIPQMILSSIVSPLLTRGKLQNWMFASDLLRAVIVLVVPVCYLLDRLPIWLFFVSALLQSAIGAFYTPASVALLPKVVSPSRVQPANAFLQSSSQVAALAGLAGGGAFVTLLSADTTLLITSGLFLLSSGLVLFVKSNEDTVANESRSKEQISYGSRIREGFAVVRRHRLLFGLAIFATFINLGCAPFLALSAVYVSDHLQGDASTFTMIRASIAFGALVAGLLLAKIKVRRQGALFVTAGIVSGIVFVLMGFSHELWLVIACCLIFGMAQSAINVPEMVIVQTTVPPHQQAQVFSVLMTLSFALLPFAVLASGPLAALLGTGKAIAIGGFVIILSGGIVYFVTPLAKLRPGVHPGSRIAG